VTYLIATSLILTGGLQLAFTRFISDRLFERRARTSSAQLQRPAAVGDPGVSAAGITGSCSSCCPEPLLYRLLMLAGLSS
jgi:uncharacterized membrane protein